MDLNNLLNFHVKHGYYIFVQETDKGCTCYFPANLTLEYPTIEEFINFELLDNCIRFQIMACPWKEIPCDNYVKRLFIFTHIIIKMIQLDIPIEYIENITLILDKNNNRRDFLDILPRPTSVDDIEKEKKLKSVYNDILLGLFDDTSANKLGILRGFNLLSGLFLSGGLI